MNVHSVNRYLDAAGCPDARPALADMADDTRALHAALDANRPWLHPTAKTIQRDLRGSPEVIAWQEGKAGFLIGGDGAWSELPHLYARYGTPGVARLIRELRALEGARAAIATDCGMQAIALVADVVIEAGSHVVAMRQVYNKTRTFLAVTARRVGATLALVDDGDLAALAAALTPATRLVLAETYTNPLLRAQDIGALVGIVRERSPQAKLVIDSTIATPWGLAAPLLAQGVHAVVGSLTKALGGTDTALGGYIATDDADLGNQIMDLVAMRGGILDEDRAARIADGLADGSASAAHARRCATAARLAAFLATHPRVEVVNHPSLATHPDAAAIARGYVRHASLLSLRVRDADEAATGRITDALATCIVPRYALSFDGLATKINHHRTVSEYFTPPESVVRYGLDRLLRIGVGIEDADDIIACVNWALHHGADVSPDDLAAWRASRGSADVTSEARGP